jgi:hypothetical protein
VGGSIGQAGTTLPRLPPQLASASAWSSDYSQHNNPDPKTHDMSITFGSVGDILAICALVKDCVDALSDTNGSAPQYQAVVRELEILQKALLEVGVLSRTHAITPELTALFISADTTIERCRQTLAQFKVKVQPYDKHLSASPRGSPVQKICNRNAKKLLWHIKMKDEVTRFRAEVVAFSVSIHQILSAATMCVHSEL